MNEQPQPGLFIGIDWADQKHDCYVIDRNGKGIHQEIKHSPEDIDTWVGEMLKRADGKPIAIMLEQSRGPLVHALMFRENVLLFPINPSNWSAIVKVTLAAVRTTLPMPSIWHACFVNESRR